MVLCCQWIQLVTGFVLSHPDPSGDSVTKAVNFTAREKVGSLATWRSQPGWAVSPQSKSPSATCVLPQLFRKLLSSKNTFSSASSFRRRFHKQYDEVAKLFQGCTTQEFHAYLSVQGAKGRNLHTYKIKVLGRRLSYLLFSMIRDVLIWRNFLSCDPLSLHS